MQITPSTSSRLAIPFTRSVQLKPLTKPPFAETRFAGAALPPQPAVPGRFRRTLAWIKQHTAGRIAGQSNSLPEPGILFRAPNFDVRRVVDETGRPWVFSAARHGNQVAIVIPVKDGKLILIEQNRPGMSAKNGVDSAKVIELPGGKIGDVPGRETETPEEAAGVELLEEAGYQAAHLVEEVESPLAPGTSNLIAHFVRAEGLTKVTDKLGVEGENILALHEVPLDQVHDWLEAKRQAGYRINSAVYIGLYCLQRRAQRPPGDA